MPTLSELTLGIFRDDAVSAGLAAAITPSTHPHPRARIRSWVRARLQAGALTPARIVATRGTPTAMAGVPAVFLYTLTEREPDRFTAEMAGTLNRGIELACHIVVPEDGIPIGAGLDDVLDAFAYVIERLVLLDSAVRGNALGAPPYQFFGGDGQSCELGGTSIELEDSGDRLLHHARIAFAVQYQDALETADELSDLELVAAEWDLAPPDAQLDAADDIEIEQE
jgi:hypothetical protein